MYRSGPRAVTEAERHPVGLGPASVVAYCMDHLRGELKKSPFAHVNYVFENGHYDGRFQFLRNDTSVDTVDAKEVETYVFDGRSWFRLGEQPDAFVEFYRTERFPHEPWPPEFQP